MKITILLISLFFFSSLLHAQDYWQKINTPDSLTLTDVMVDNQGRIFISCWNNFSKGGVYRSDDDGYSWERKNNGLYVPNQSILQLETNSYGTLFAGAQSMIFKSSDSGNTWTQVYKTPMYAANMHTVKCGYDSIILVGGENQDGIIRSGDFGITWQKVLDISHPYWFESITDIQFGQNGIIYACSRITLSNDPGMVYTSYDQGRTWQVFCEAGYPMALGFDNQGRLLRGEFGNGLYRYDFTTSIWEHILYNGSSPRSILTVPDGKLFLGCGYYPNNLGGVMLSIDDGNSYQFNNSGLLGFDKDSDNLIEDNIGRVLVLSLGLYRSFDTIFTSVKKINTEEDQLLAYPSPFHSSVTIKYNGSYKKGADSMLFIYNSSGQLILQENVHNQQEYRWDGSALPLGLYIIKISNGKSTSTIKVLHY
ncbi:MAG: T9SS type A sorting domain-containing protein [Bacteroidota bacterium]